MSIEKTEYISKLSSEDLKLVAKKWPNPYIILGGFIASGVYLFFSAGSASPADRLISPATVFLGLLFLVLIYTYVTLSDAKIALFEKTDPLSFPRHEVLKEFKKNLRKIKRL